MNSPFPYERLPLKEEFFGRTKELEKLSTIAKYSNNLLIHWECSRFCVSI